MIIALVSGSLFRAPEQRTAKSGKPFVAGTLRAKTNEAMQYVRFVAFSESAMAELMRLSDGDAVSVQGPFKAELYSKDGGEPKISLSIVADLVVAIRQPPKKRKPETSAPPDTRTREQRCRGEWQPGAGPSDEIPFGGEP